MRAIRPRTCKHRVCSETGWSPPAAKATPSQGISEKIHCSKSRISAGNATLAITFGCSPYKINLYTCRGGLHGTRLLFAEGEAGTIGGIQGKTQNRVAGNVTGAARDRMAQLLAVSSSGWFVGRLL